MKQKGMLVQVVCHAELPAGESHKKGRLRKGREGNRSVIWSFHFYLYDSYRTWTITVNMTERDIFNIAAVELNSKFIKKINSYGFSARNAKKHTIFN